jgi:DnaJ-class molecular chaperone
VNIWQLITGGSSQIKDVLGNILEVTIPARTQPGTTVRLRGRGLNVKGRETGDLLVQLQARIPDHIDPELLSLIEKTQQ